MLNFLDLVYAASDARPDNKAITLKGETLTYRELTAGITNVAANAVAHGAVAGDRFLFAAKPSPTSIMVTLGLLKAGLTLVFVDPFSSPDLFASRSTLVNPAYTVADSLLYTLGHPRLARARAWKNVSVCDYGSVDAGHLFIGRRLPGLPRAAVSMSDWIRSAPRGVIIPPADPDADAVITFTSGTTSDPKGVVHSLGTLSANMPVFGALLNLRPGQKIYSEPMTLGAVALSHGAEWHIPAKSDRVPDADVYFAVPTVVLATLDKIEASRRTPLIRTVATGAAPVLPSLVSRISHVLGESTTILNVYGMTEMLPIAVGDARLKAQRPTGDLLGTPVGDTEIRIGDNREILVRGSGLMKRYFGREPAGWHPTGDLGLVDDDGQLVMLGRKKNMLIRGNMNIYPSLYESSISLIANVEDAVIVGVGDEYGDDVICLFITVTPGADAERVRSEVAKDLVNHMDADAIPDHVFVIDSIPTSGRALKRDMGDLHAIAVERLGKL